MITPGAGILTMLVASILWLLMEATVHVRAALRDYRLHRGMNPTYEQLPAKWDSRQGARLGSALAKQRPGR